jgi:hypothetical protein
MHKIELKPKEQTAKIKVVVLNDPEKYAEESLKADMQTVSFLHV